MDAYKVAATVAQDGTVVLKGLPLTPGKVVEVIVLASHHSDSSFSSPPSTLDPDYLAGLSAHMDEWASPDDEAAYCDL
ncbi:MAG: hypothetical protein AAF722_06460 [Cyanobacteria bacterium P01_C01_bin.70]